MSALAIDHRIADDQVVWAFGPKMTPVLEVDPGTVVTLAMKDGLNGQITREDQLVRDILTDLDLTHVNGATGPIAVRGAEPGDSLVVDILAIRTAASGVALVIPGVGQLHRHGLDARTKLFDVDGDTIHMNERISFPIRPMLGVMGVATGSEEVLNGFAGEHGGNLDNHLHGPGARIYFPVRQPGGMFAAGDMHASMGDGEISGTGVEIAGEVDIRLGLVKGRQGRWPVTELDGHWVAHATSLGRSARGGRAGLGGGRAAARRPVGILARRGVHLPLGGVRRRHRAGLPAVAVLVDRARDDSQDHGVPSAVRRLSFG